MRTSTLAVSAALLMSTVVTPPVSAQSAAGTTAFLLSPASRVRCLDQEARKLLEAALAVSPTIVRIVTDLQSTDLIVGIETEVLKKRGLNGDARVTSASPAVRHVRIRVGIPNSRSSLIAVLGHELQHASEIAAAPDVRDAAAQRAHYLRIGFEPVGRGYYETDAALETGRLVAAEVAAARRTTRPETRGH
jgi:hypothetical protein